MSTSSARSEQSTSAHRKLTTEPLSLLYTPVQFVGFWTAVLLPFVTFPMVATGVASAHLVPFLALVVVNVVALVLGRGYKAD
jgi:heme/copper-type cytochrome/quinol oxidase subunit 4